MMNNVGQMTTCSNTLMKGNEGVLYNTPVLFESQGFKDFVRAPKKGEHTIETLKELGYSDEQIEELRNANVIA